MWIAIGRGATSSSVSLNQQLQMLAPETNELSLEDAELVDKNNIYTYICIYTYNWIRV